MKLREISKRTWLAAALLVAGIVLRLEYLREFASLSPLYDLALGPDIAEYDRRAREILSGTLTPPTPDIHAPLYSWVLAGLYRISAFSVPFIRVVQSLLQVGAWGAFYVYWRRRSAPNSAVPEIFLGFAMLYPALWFFAAELVSESLLIPLLLLALGCFDHAERSRKPLLWNGAGGFAAGLAAITHPMALLYLAAETGWHLWHKPRMRGLLILVAGLLPIVPVAICRSQEAGRPVLIQANSAFNLYLGNNPDADGSCYIRPGVEWRKIHAETAAESRANGITADRVYQKKILDFWLHHPIQSLEKFARKALLVFSPTELPAGADTPLLFQATPLVRHLAAPITAAVLILAVAGALLLARQREERRAMIHVLLLGGAFYLAQVLTVTSGRYRLAMLPAFFLLAAYYCGATRKTWPLLAGTMLVCGSLLFQPKRPDADLESMSLLAEGWFRHDELARAEELLTKTAHHDPDRDANLLGEIYRRQQRYPEAQQQFEYAATHAPTEASGVMNLAIMASMRQDYPKSEALFREAARRDPGHADTAYNHGWVLEQQGKFAEAEAQYRRALKEDPTHRRSINSLGVLAFRRGDLADAERWFELATRLEPSNANLRKNLELVRSRANRNHP